MTRYEAALKYLQDQKIVVSESAMEALEDYYGCVQDIELEKNTIVYNNYIFKTIIYEGKNAIDALEVYKHLLAIKMLYEN